MSSAVGTFIWEKGFPPVYGHTSISFLKRCPGFEDAKKGDILAAAAVVKSCVKPKRIEELRNKYPCAVLLPVITDNKLPQAFAAVFGLRVHTGMDGHRNLSRKSFSAMERLLNKPHFKGTVTCGQSYIIVDDIVTQGGTVAALREHVIAGGGKVVAVTALAYSVDSGGLAPSAEDFEELERKLNTRKATYILQCYRELGEIGELTRAQVRYLIRFKNGSTMIKKIIISSKLLLEKAAKEEDMTARAA